MPPGGLPSPWRLLLPRDELDLERTLTSGQSFRFAGSCGKLGRGCFSQQGGALSGVLTTGDVVELRYCATGQTAGAEEWTEWRVVAGRLDRAEGELRRLLHAEAPPLAPLELAFAAACPAYAAQRRRLGGRCGVRLLAVAPFEALIAFVLSSVNNVVRISQIVERLAKHFEGNLLHVAEGGRRYYRFPSPQQLATLSEARLRDLGCGFRAPFVQAAAQEVVARGDDWLLSLSAERATAEEARAELMALRGVGRKVADCVLMASLGHHSVVPVDTHCWQMVQRWYLPHLRGKSLTAARYEEAASAITARFGGYAGWAFMGLFCAELASFKASLLEDSLDDMDLDDNGAQHYCEEVRAAACARAPPSTPGSVTDGSRGLQRKRRRPTPPEPAIAEAVR